MYQGQFRAVRFGALPDAIVRGGVFGLILAPVLAFTFGTIVVVTSNEFSSVMSVLSPAVVSTITVVSVGVTISASFALAFVAYGNRIYEFGQDGITVRRKLLFERQQFLAYEEMSTIAFEQTRRQALYGTGTIELNVLGYKPDIELRYIEEPGNAYTLLIDNVAESAGSLGDPPEDIDESDGESETVSHLSGHLLASGTGFDYQMPSNVLQPRPLYAVRFGLVRALVYALVGLVLTAVIYDSVGDPLGALPVEMGLVAAPPRSWYLKWIILSVVSFLGCLALYYYFKWRRTQYELYPTHIRRVRGRTVTSVVLGNIDGFEVKFGDPPSDPGLLDYLLFVGFEYELEIDGRNDTFSLYFIEADEEAETNAYLTAVV